MSNRKWGYWRELDQIQFDEGTATWIMAMPLGKYDHPVHGEIDITPPMVQAFADGVKNKVRGQDLDIDYDHKEYGGEAAGWVKDADVRSDGLWILVDWTKKAFSLIKDKAYRYFSPEFADEWTHPKTHEKHTNVLYGGALTNRPFLKDILAINMSELIDPGTAPSPTPAPNNDPPAGGGEMDGKLIRAALGLEESVSDADVVLKLAELRGVPAPTPTEPSDPAPTPKFDVNNPQSVQDALKQLSDVSGNPAIKSLTELVKAQGEQLVKMRDRERALRVEKMLDDLDAGKKFTVPPVVKDQLREMLLSPTMSDGVAQQAYEAYKQTLEIGMIDMTERGWQRRHGEQSPAQLFLTAIDERMAADKSLSYADAANIVGRENPDLARQYREDSYIPSER